MKKYSFFLKGLECSNCANKIQKEVASYPQYQNVTVNFSTLKLNFQTDDNPTKVVANIQKIVSSVEPGVEVLEGEENINHHDSQYKAIIRLLLGIVIASIGFMFHFPFKISEILVIIAYILLLLRTIKNAYYIFKRSKSIDENFLVILSCIGAYLVGEHMEGFMVIVLYEIGKILEAKAINNTRKSIKELINIKPEYANLKTKKGYEKVSPEELKVGDVIVIKQGEKVPMDGVVIEGISYLDTSILTGESDVQKIEKGDTILSGSINIDSLLEVKVTCEYENSTVNKILQLVENATDHKSKTETFVSKLAKIYTPIVLILACLVALLLPIFTDISYSASIYRALIFLVISCPCAIAISVPLSYFSGIGRASKQGILIKGSNYLDNLKEVKTIIFDKTGTLTTGSFEVKEIKSFDIKYSEEDILNLLAKGESFSNHPIAKSILKKVGKKVDTRDVSNYKELSGKGIQYTIHNKQVKIGNAIFTNYLGQEKTNYTTIYLNYDGMVIGSASIDDGIKSDAKDTICKLHHLGIQTFMLTGDNKQVALHIAKRLGIDGVYYELLPTDKYELLEKLMQNDDNRLVAFVGDGINDAPVIARSDIGFSMGNLGSSSSIEASDIVLMTDELKKIIQAIEISNITRRIIKQNLVFAVSTKILVLLLSVFGIAGMWQAVFADVGVTLITILNTTRILKQKETTPS